MRLGCLFNVSKPSANRQQTVSTSGDFRGDAVLSLVESADILLTNSGFTPPPDSHRQIFIF